MYNFLHAISIPAATQAAVNLPTYIPILATAFW